jgi:threonine/homoserine/homoserine lactone efflux protein
VLAAFLVAFVLSFVGSMPIAGPIAVIVLSKGLAGHVRSGVFLAIGAAIAEAVYAGLAFLGITAMIERYPILLPISRLVGCLILIALGVAFLVKKQGEPSTKAEDDKSREGTTDLGSAFVGLSITAINPTLIVTWTGAVSAVHAAKLLRVSELDALPFAAGVLTGIITWFSTFLALLGKWNKKLQPSSIQRVIKAMGVVLIIAGVGFGVRTIVQWQAAHTGLSLGSARTPLRV